MQQYLTQEFKACFLLQSPVTVKCLSLLTDPLKNKNTTYIIFPTGICEIPERQMQQVVLLQIYDNQSLYFKQIKMHSKLKVFSIPCSHLQRPIFSIQSSMEEKKQVYVLLLLSENVLRVYAGLFLRRMFHVEQRNNGGISNIKIWVRDKFQLSAAELRQLKHYRRGKYHSASGLNTANCIQQIKKKITSLMLAVTKSLSTYKTDVVQLRDQSDPQPNSNMKHKDCCSFIVSPVFCTWLQVFWNMHPIYRLPVPELQPAPQLG